MANAFDEKILGERQKIALAQKLRESGQEIPQGRMVGDRFVGASWTQGLAQALKQGLGAYDEAQAENKIKDLEGERTRGSIEALGSMGLQASPEMLKQAGTPEQSPSLFKRAGALLSGEDQPQTIPAQPYQQNVAQNVTPDQFDAGALKLMSYDPTMAAGAIGLSSARAAREAAAAEKAYSHNQDKLQAEAKVEAASEANKFRASESDLNRQNQLAMHNDTIANRQVPQAPQGSVVEIVDPNDPTRMVKKNTLTGEVYGYSGAEPKAAIRQEKAAAATEKQDIAKEGFSTELDTLKSNYDYLNTHGGITNPANSGLSNIAAYASNLTGPTLGAMGGTYNQSARNKIEGSRSRMIPLFKEATGMSSKQMDANAELKAAKNTLTNPDADYASNMEAIAHLQKAYADHQTSGDIQSPAPNTQQTQTNTNVDPFAGFTPAQKAEYQRLHGGQ